MLRYHAKAYTMVNPKLFSLCPLSFWDQCSLLVCQLPSFYHINTPSLIYPLRVGLYLIEICMYMRGAQLGELTFLYHLGETVLWHTLTSCRAFNTNTYYVELSPLCIVPVQGGMPAVKAVPVVLGPTHVSHVI